MEYQRSEIQLRHTSVIWPRPEGHAKTRPLSRWVDGSDTIEDMSVGDTLRFDDLADTVSDTAGLESAVTVLDDGVDTTITFDTGLETITLTGVTGSLDSLAALDTAGYNIEIV